MQAPKDDPQTSRLLGADASLHALLEEPLQPLVPEASDHIVECNPGRYALQAGPHCVRSPFTLSLGEGAAAYASAPSAARRPRGRGRPRR